jgi:hypothetical protein
LNKRKSLENGTECAGELSKGLVLLGDGSTDRGLPAYIKKTLKKEYVDKLNLLGLKWPVHQRQENEDIDLDGRESEHEGQGDVPHNGGSTENSSGKENSQRELNEQIEVV